jgi:hypothetical protein
MTTSPLAATSSHPDTSEFCRLYTYQNISIVDLEGLSPDPDPAFQVVLDPNPDPTL